MMTVDKLNAEQKAFYNSLPEGMRAAFLKTLTKTHGGLKVSARGAVSLYGLGRFPVTLYKSQWLRLLDLADAIRAFIQANDDKLAEKEESEKKSA